MKENQWKMKGKPIQTEKQKKQKIPKKSEPSIYIYIIFTKTGNGGVTTYELT